MRRTSRRTTSHAAWILAILLTLAAAPALHAAPDDGPDDWDDFGRQLAAAAPISSFLAAEVTNRDCHPVFSVAAERPVAIASTFKLYVLGELARRVATDQASWNDQLRVDDRWRSKASGEMRYEPAGTAHTLRYFAERMIADSDNTATDHLIAHLGRENVEAMHSLLGHRAPELNTPLLMTRELFALKIAAEEGPIDAYLAAPDEVQRRFLETEVAPRPVAPEGWGDWSGPERIDLEWFASASDVCRALARLHRMAERPELGPVSQILGLNRGGPLFDRKTWPYAGFKMGSEAGVYNLTWLLERSDDRLFVVTAGFNDPVVGIDQGAVWALMERAEVLLSRTP